MTKKEKGIKEKHDKIMQSSTREERLNALRSVAGAYEELNNKTDDELKQSGMEKH